MFLETSIRSRGLFITAIALSHSGLSPASSRTNAGRFPIHGKEGVIARNGTATTMVVCHSPGIQLGRHGKEEQTTR